MAPQRKLVAIAILSLWMGCNEDSNTPDDTAAAPEVEADKPSTPSKTDAATGASEAPTASRPDDDLQPTPDAGKPTPDAGQPASGDSDSGASVVAPDAQQPAAFDYENETVELKKDLVIAAGETVRVGPGVTFHATGNYKVQVDGQLEVEASQAQPSSFTGGTNPSSWHGIVVSEGGSLKLSHAEISGAQYGIYAEAGSQFTVDASEIRSSFKAAVIFSDGTFTNTRFKASIPPTIAITEEVAVDDPNGCLTIIDASPTVTNCQFDGASPFTDLVRIGGASSPTFDHVYLHSAHCGFHIAGSSSASARISHALLEDFSYGFMSFSTKPIVEDSVFKDNTNDFGLCAGSKANAPALKNNFYSGGGDVLLDASCDRIGTADPSPASAASPDVGAKL